MLVIPLLSIIAAGCLLVRTTEHRIKINPDGTGEATLRLVDLRSDASTDSAAFHDYGVMMGGLKEEGERDLEGRSRKLTGKKFTVRGDTLTAELTYLFLSLSSVDGIRMVGDELFFVVGEGEVVVKTNGKIESWGPHGTRIVWKRDARQLMYQIRERKMPPSRSLAPFYTKYGQ